jgi:hypothetical protein
MKRVFSSSRMLFSSKFFSAKEFGSFFCCLLFLILAVLSQGAAFAQDEGGVGSVMVAPTRIVFEGRTRSSSVKVVNSGTKKTTYRITFKDMRMNENGTYEDVKEALPDDKSAKNMVRFSPRQVVLKPGESQTVRLLLRKKKGLPEGEYRSHMLFTALPSEGAGANIESLAGDKGDVKLKLIAIFGVTIPVIVRHGKGSAAAEMADLKIKEPEEPGSSKFLSIRINRLGNQSLFGDIHAKFTPKGGGEELEVGRVTGVAVYTPNKSRVITLPLNPPEGTEVKQGRLHVLYRDDPEKSDKILAEGQLQLP